MPTRSWQPLRSMTARAGALHANPQTTREKSTPGLWLLPESAGHGSEPEGSCRSPSCTSLGRDRGEGVSISTAGLQPSPGRARRENQGCSGLCCQSTYWPRWFCSLQQKTCPDMSFNAFKWLCARTVQEQVCLLLSHPCHGAATSTHR